MRKKKNQPLKVFKSLNRKDFLTILSICIFPLLPIIIQYDTIVFVNEYENKNFKTDFYPFQPKNSASENFKNLFYQNFNTEIPANYLGDQIWRIPNGWMSNNYNGDFTPGNFAYSFTDEAEPGGHFNTTFLSMNDYNNAGSTYIERYLPAVINGSFEFKYTMITFLSESYNNDVVLQTIDGRNLLNFSSFNPINSEFWNISLQGVDSGLSFNSNQGYVNVKIDFDGILANLTINGTEMLNNIPYTSGMVHKIRLSTGDTGGISSAGQGRFDNFNLTGIYQEFIPNTPDNIIFEDNFNENLPADNFADGIWRIPNGWVGNNHTNDFPDISPLYPYTHVANTSTNFKTTYLAIKDHNNSESTFIEREIDPLINGSFELKYSIELFQNDSFQNNILLQTSNGINLIKITSFKPNETEYWDISLQDINAGLNIGRNESIYIKLIFNGSSANLYVNGTEMLTGISYNSGIIENLRINTGFTGQISTGGQGFFDDFIIAGHLYQSAQIDTTNGVSQKIYNNNVILECIDESNNYWMKILLSSEIGNEFRLIFNSSNPTIINESNNIELSHFYCIESLETDEYTMSGYLFYNNSLRAAENENSIFVYKLSYGAWEKVEADHIKKENYFLIFDMELNTNYAIGIENIKLGIEGFSPFSFLIFSLISIFKMKDKIQRTSKADENKKKKDK